MRKNNKGITIIALVITIVVLGILATIAIRTSSPVIEEARMEEVRTTLLLIQAKWKVEIEKSKFNGDSMFPTDQIIPKEENEEKKWQLISSYEVTAKENWNVDTSITYYKLNQDRLNDMGLSDVNAGKGYIVNYSNNDIILESGIEYEGTTYYKLSDLENL